MPSLTASARPPTPMRIASASPGRATTTGPAATPTRQPEPERHDRAQCTGAGTRSRPRPPGCDAPSRTFLAALACGPGSRRPRAATSPAAPRRRPRRSSRRRWRSRRSPAPAAPARRRRRGSGRVRRAGAGQGDRQRREADQDRHELLEALGRGGEQPGRRRPRRPARRPGPCAAATGPGRPVRAATPHIEPTALNTSATVLVTLAVTGGSPTASSAG